MKNMTSIKNQKNLHTLLDKPKKRQKDISDIDQKIISMYAKGMTTRQISDQFTIYFLKRKLIAFHLFCRSSMNQDNSDNQHIQI